MRDLALTFAGGGSRAFYQVGVLERWIDALEPRLAAVAACSAGAAMATLVLTRRTEQARRAFARRRLGVRGHLDLRRLARGQRPFPHDGIYRATLRDALSEGGFERLKALPFPVKILCATFPRRARGPLGIAVGLGAYQLEKALRPKLVHPSFPQKLGFRPRVWDARECATIDELIELIVSSSSTPPFTSVGRFREHTLIDGSMVDNAPAFLAEEDPGVAKNLVLLTRPHHPSRLGWQGKRLYIAPARKLPIARWDYTEQAPVDETLALGRLDGQRHRAAIEALLA